uniref:RHS repeat protein n=1 Tax=Geobacter metallireducens TaxID=28232 RepID=A0A831UGN7_GEOME
MVGDVMYLKRFSKVVSVLVPLVLVLASGWVGSAHANSCKTWQQVANICSPGDCSNHSQWWCDAPDGDFCYGPKYYTSDTTREAIYWSARPVTLNGATCSDGCTKVKEAYLCAPCAAPNKITSFGADKFEITAGETVTFSWSSSGCIDNSTLTVGGKTFTGGGSAAWTGTDADYQITKPKKYPATLTVSGDCCGSDTKTIEITVMPPPKTCQLIPKFNSSVNVATGSLLQSEQLFAAKGSLATGVTLTYDSLDSHIGPLGGKWSHSYDIGLEQHGDGSVTLRDGSTWSFYNLVNGVFVSETGDSSTLVKTADNTYTLTHKDGTKKKFSAAGKIISITDANGNSTTFAYDDAGNLASVTDAASRATTFAYDAGTNRLTTITDPAGKEYTFTYNGSYLAAVTWPDTSSWQYTYDAKGFMLTKTDPLGKVTTYEYDANRRVILGTNPAGQTKGVAYPTATTTVKSSTFTDNNGGEWTYTYDSHNGLLTEKIDPLGKSTTYTYDANRNLTRETAPDGSTTSYTYDGAGNMLTMTDALGKTTTYSYNSLGQVTSTTDPLGLTTTSSYDAKGRLTETVDPLGAKTTYVYDAQGNLTSVTNPLNQTTSYTYDDAGNQTSVTEPGGGTTSFTYDAMGNMLTQTDSQGKVTTFAYDGRYRLATVTDPLGNVTTYGYDVKGNKTSQTDANGNETRYEYDDEGHLVTTIDAQGNATTYTYNSSGCTSCGGTDKLTSLTDAKGQTTSFEYDPLGRLIQETDPLGKITTYTYDAVGNLKTRTDANGATITYTYDPLKRLTNKSYPDTTSESYTYDAVGRILTAANANVAYTYAYDTAGRVTSVTDSRGYRLDYSYGLLGNRTRMTLQPGTADERVTTYGYDAAGRLTAITSSAGTFSYDYDGIGRRTSLAYPNRITTSYTYDDAGRLTTLSHGTVASFTYTLDKVGNRTGKTHTEAEQYLYDTVYRLLTVTSTKPEAFTFDPVGNRLTGPGAKDTAYLYNAGNQMTQGRKLSYGYDNNGNQTTRTVPAATDKTWTQTWDFENRLVAMEKVKGAERKTVTFTYDPQGRRIGKQVTTTIDGVTRTSTYAYVYDNDNIVLEILTDDSGTTTTFYTHGAGTDEHLALERGGSFYYYHADGLGSVTTITDQQGSVVQSYEYDSFGMVKASTGFRNSYTYTGREWDKETGLYYYRARYYDPIEGRFIQKDPIGFKGGDVNLYAYVQNNPINLVDPSGQASYGAGAYAGPGGEFTYNTATCCENNASYEVKYYTICGGAGIGAKGGLSKGDVSGTLGFGSVSSDEGCPRTHTYLKRETTFVARSVNVKVNFDSIPSAGIDLGLYGIGTTWVVCGDVVISKTKKSSCCNNK